MDQVWKKSGLGGFGYTRILECRVRVCRVLKKVGFGRVILGLGIPGLITTSLPLTWSLLTLHPRFADDWCPIFCNFRRYHTIWLNNRALVIPRKNKPCRGIFWRGVVISSGSPLTASIQSCWLKRPHLRSKRYETRKSFAARARYQEESSKSSGGTQRCL